MTGVMSEAKNEVNYDDTHTIYAQKGGQPANNLAELQGAGSSTFLGQIRST